MKITIFLSLLAACGAAIGAPTDDNAQMMPRASMPKGGLLVSYDFDEGAAVNAGYGTAVLHRNDIAFRDGAAVFDGRYGNGRQGGDDFIVPELNYDHFAVAFSFCPSVAKDMFRIGTYCHAMFEINNGTWDGDHVEVFVNGSPVEPVKSPITLGKWNWIVVSFDKPKRLMLVSVNGLPPVERLLPADFFWRMPPGGNVGDAFRRIHFGNAQCGVRYQGMIDDLMVYDRALTQTEMLRIVKRQPAQGPAQPIASSESKGTKMSPVEPPEGKWLFVPHAETSLYWNGVIRTRGLTLAARRTPDGLVVQPIGLLPAETVDLSLPVLAPSGEKVPIILIGAPVDGVGGAIGGVGRSQTRTVRLPSTLRMLGDWALACCCDLSEIDLPPSLETIGNSAFYKCSRLQEVVIPEKVTTIGQEAFSGCGSLMRLDVRSRHVKIEKDAFSQNTPVGSLLPEGPWSTGPVLKEIKGDSKYADAKFGRMEKPLFSCSYGDIRLGDDTWGTTSGLGGFLIDGHDELGNLDMGFMKVGPGLLAGFSLDWFEKGKANEAIDLAKGMSVKLARFFEQKLGVKMPALVWTPVESWPKHGDTGYFFAPDRATAPVATAAAVHDGYRVTFRVYGGTEDKGITLRAELVDLYMFRAWGMPPPGEKRQDADPSRSSVEQADWRNGPDGDWFVNWNNALKAAKKSGKKLYVLKAGSDWCAPYAELFDKVLSQKKFKDYARKNLVLVFIDSPSKRPLPAVQKRHNLQVSRALGLGGGIPCAMVVDATGRSFGSLSGKPQTETAYLKKLREMTSGRGKMLRGEAAKRLFSTGIVD